MMPTTKLHLSRLVPAVIAAGSLWLAPAVGGPGAPTVVRGSLEKRFLGSGELKTMTSSFITTPVSESWRTRITRLVAHGAPVKEGDVVAVFDTAEIEQNLKKTELELVELDNEREAARMTAAREQSELSGQLQVALIELEKTGLRLKIDPALLTPEEAENRQFDHDRLDLDVKKIRGQVQQKEIENRLSSDIFELKRKRLLSTIERARGEIDRMTMRAPRSGVALCSTNWQEKRPYQTGDEARAGEDIVEIPEMSGMEALLAVSEVDAFALRPGMKADILLDSRPDKPFTGAVKSIASILHQKRGSELKTFEVVLSVEGFDADVMRPGMSLVASILLERVDNALLVPRETLGSPDRNSFVRVRDADDGVRDVPVTITVWNDRQAAVTGALAEGAALEPLWPETERSAP